jgi:hypothetical protein
MQGSTLQRQRTSIDDIRMVEQKVGDEIPAGCELIEVHVPELRLLFNPIDPSPPRERDLDAKAEEFIVSWARSLRRDARLALRVDVDKSEVPPEAEIVGDATREFFRQRSLSASRRLSQLFRVGRTSLVIGIAFLALAVTLAGLVSGALGESAFAALLRESMVIGGWVAMWRPLEIFLYDWWPILAERKLYDRLSVMPVSVSFR